MKITSLLIGVCLLPVLTGCHKPQTSEVIGATEAAIKTTALASVTAKYPDLSSSDLKFVDLNIRAMPNGQEGIFVTYDVLATAKTMTEGNKTKTTTQTINVAMLLSGKVGAVYENTRTLTRNAAQQSKPMPNTALEPTPTAP